MNILILQKNTKKAGAQTALIRLIKAQKKLYPEINVIVICSDKGWLFQELVQMNVLVYSIRYHSVKSLIGYIFKNSNWVNKVYKILKKNNFEPNIIHANNHIEAFFANKLSKKFRNTKTAVFFRDSHMKKKDYYSYHCDFINYKICVSEYLKNEFSFISNCRVISDGLLEEEILPYVRKKQQFPKRVLLLGAPHVEKGWDDFFWILEKIEKEKGIVLFDEIVTTGIPNSKHLKNYKSTNYQRVKFHEKFDNISIVSLDFDLVVFLSKKESFGLAALEVIASGVPLFSTNVGIINNIVTNNNFIVDIDKKSIENGLLNLYCNWENINFDLEKDKTKIKEKYMIENELVKLISIYEGNK